MTATGTEKKQGHDTSPAPGGEGLTRRDASPRKAGARIGLLALLALIVLILLFAFIWADDAPVDLIEPAVILNDAGDGLGN